MPVPFITKVASEGIDSVPGLWTVLKAIPWLVLLYALKAYFGGASNRSERVMHSKVVLMTGATSGIGAVVARELARRGAQLVLLTHAPLTDPFLVDFIMDLRDSTGNQLITAEHVDLGSLHSIRTFATKWIDNKPARRLDMIIMCATSQTPTLTTTEDGVESCWGINYLANFHLLSILSPAIRVQPPDRDVRIIVGMCASYMGGSLNEHNQARSEKSSEKSSKKQKTADKGPTSKPNAYNSSTAFAASKLALFTFAMAFQKHLTSYSRPDKRPNNARVFLVDPGLTRTPGMMRYLTGGSLWGLAAYLLTWPFWWLVLKSPHQGAQSLLCAAMEESLLKSDGGVLIKECGIRAPLKAEVSDEAVQKWLWEGSDKMVTAYETESALRRKVEEQVKKAKAETESDDTVSTEAEKRGSQEKTPGPGRSRRAA